ncbi:MAG: serine hydrolase [Gammaproteobacteria bacterium]
MVSILSVVDSLARKCEPTVINPDHTKTSFGLIASILFGLVVICLPIAAKAAGKAASPDPCPAVRARVNRLIKPWLAKDGGGDKKTVDAMVGLYLNGKTCYFGYGRTRIRDGHVPTRRTLFEIGSVTKTFTATMLALREVRNPAFSAQSPVNISGIPCARGLCLHLSSGMKGLTYQDLATFTGGLPDDPTNLHGVGMRHYTQADFIAYLNGLSAPQTGLPTVDRYSNSSYGFLGQLLMARAGYRDFDNPDAFRASFDKWIGHAITMPLGMNCTAADIASLPRECAAQSEMAKGYRFAHGRRIVVREPWPWVPWVPWGPAGALRSNVQDLVRYVAAYVGALEVGGAAVPRELTRAMAVARTPAGAHWNKRSKILQAYAWVQLPAGDPSRAVVFKNGATAGFSSCIAMMPGFGTGAVILSNTANTRPCSKAIRILRSPILQNAPRRSRI